MKIKIIQYISICSDNLSILIEDCESYLNRVVNDVNLGKIEKLSIGLIVREERSDSFYQKFHKERRAKIYIGEYEKINPLTGEKIKLKNHVSIEISFLSRDLFCLDSIEITKTIAKQICEKMRKLKIKEDFFDKDKFVSILENTLEL